MTDRRCRCGESGPGRCPYDATAEDLLCDGCRSSIERGFTAVAIVALRDPDTNEPTGDHTHLHCTPPVIAYPDILDTPTRLPR